MTNSTQNPLVSRAALLFLGALALVGCEDRETSRARNEQKLPVGCRIIDLDYGELRAAVVCEGRKTTTSLREWTETITYPQQIGNVTIMQTQIIPRSNLTAEIGSVE